MGREKLKASHVFARVVMAACFGEPVNDAKEVSLRVGTIPDNTKVSTALEWTAGRATPVAAEMIFKKCAITSYCTLKCSMGDLLHTFCAV